MTEVTASEPEPRKVKGSHERISQMATKTATREVTILARVEFKADSRKVVYQCLSSNGKDTYMTYLFNGKASSCECKATKPCYHMTGCEAYEAARNASKQSHEDENARRAMMHALYNVDGLDSL